MIQPEKTNAGAAAAASRGRIARLLLVLLGLVVGQVFLYGPSLVGRKILLPLDVLAQPNIYLPQTPETAKIVPHDIVLSDLILQFETERRFVAEEMRAGRFPLWLPYQYAGVPLVWPRFSPFLLLACITPSPLILPWSQLAAAIIAGFGMYAFCRRALGLKFWAATIPSWCYPLTGFFVFWQGFPTCASVYWFPWLLLAAYNVVQSPNRWTGAMLAGVTALVLISGHIDVAGQSLMAAGLFAAWLVADRFRRSRDFRPVLTAIAMLLVGWGLGFVLAAPHVWPLLEYARTGARIERRAGGMEERPPGSISASAQTIFPDIHGVTRKGSLWLGKGNQVESAAATYAGLLATLVLAPLAWCSRRHRSFLACWVVLGFVGLAWSLNVPGLVAVLRLPGLNMMSHNRLVFVTSFAILAHAAIALDLLLTGDVRRRWWFWVPASLLAVLSLWALWRAGNLPEPLATQLPNAVAAGGSAGWIRDIAAVGQVQTWFVTSALVFGALCVVGVVAWIAIWRGRTRSPVMLGILAALMLADMLWFARDRSAQCDPALYYPRIPLLEAIQHSASGRVVGYGCLPATLAQTHGLRDVRGYDSIDPAGMVNLLSLAADPRSGSPPYALTQWFFPRINLTLPDVLRLPPVLDMLGVQYLIFRGTPPAGVKPTFSSPDYWALVNKAALPRAFVPARVENVQSPAEALKHVAAPEFDPRAIAYVETAQALPLAIRGIAEIQSETPTETIVSVNMETAGLVVLADLWNRGWRAYVGDELIPILRVNSALRGVVLPAGRTVVRFRYEPSSFFYSARLSVMIIMAACFWFGISWVWPKIKSAKNL